MNEFIFLRPVWLLALLPAGFLWWYLWEKQSQKSSWKNFIAPEFQSVLLKPEAVQTGNPYGFIGLGLIWLAAIFALAGPSFHSEKIAAQKSQAGTVILLDLSLSMFADDLKPTRLTRVQHKLSDFLTSYPELRLGMIGYAGSAHLISPIADDNQIIANLIPHLDPRMMPVYGADAVAGFNLAVDLIQGAKITQGHIIWITDDLEPEEIAPIQQLIQANNLSLSLLAVGTKTGGIIKIPGGEIIKNQAGQVVQAAVPLNRLQSLATSVGGNFQQLQLNNRDLAGLKPNFYAETTDADDQKNMSQAVDYGVYLLGFMLVLAAFGLRRGWLLHLLPLVLLPSLLIQPEAAFAEQLQVKKPEIKLSDRWREMYLTNDQRGYQAWLQQDYLAAEREFINQNWQAASLYKQQNYAAAAKLFAQDVSAEGRFNLGNSYAHLNQLEQAKQAYQQALTLDPEFAAANKNLKLVEQQLAEIKDLEVNLPADLAKNLEAEKLEQQTEIEQEIQQETAPEISAENQEDSADSAAENNSGEASETSEFSEKSENSSNSKSSENSETSETAQTTAINDLTNNSAEQDIIETVTGSDLGSLANQQIELREQKQAQEAWLNQIQDQPAVFLKRKFEHQYQQNTDLRDKPKKKPW